MNPPKFNKLSFYYCSNVMIRRLFPTPKSRSVVMNGVVPLSYRNNSQQIRNFLFFGTTQKKDLLLAAGLLNDKEVEAFQEDYGEFISSPTSVLFT